MPLCISVLFLFHFFVWNWWPFSCYYNVHRNIDKINYSKTKNIFCEIMLLAPFLTLTFVHQLASCALWYQHFVWIITYNTYRAFKQSHQLEPWVHKIRWFVWIFQPGPCPPFFMFAHWSVMRKRYIIVYII